MTKIRLNDDFRQLYPNDPLNGFFLLGGLSEWLNENVTDRSGLTQYVDDQDINRPVYLEFTDSEKAQAFKAAFPRAVLTETRTTPKTP
ncbi:MAG: hypothetical protein EOP84_18260 [Verrucomicrobiaceae bacterium]|nr:MAG: hypothetical protein EOP84_18260 [Verrucomicrobiaceae bacterium]